MPLSINKDDYFDSNTLLFNNPSLPENYVLYIGRFSYYKGIFVLLDAIDLIDEDIPFVIAGDGELKEEVNLLVEQSKNSDTFVSCTQMDKDYKNSDNNLFDDTKISASWIKNLQQGIAQVTVNTLYYDLNTIRSFVAGLAMSRLSILQGIVEQVRQVYLKHLPKL